MTGSDDPDAASERVEAAIRPYLEPGDALVLAVSGGPDSTALMAAAARIGRVPSLHVATVDHGLRPGSSAEAVAVGECARELGLAHSIIPWIGPKPAHGIQAAARRARYALLRDFARRTGARQILTGHTRDDQAETVLMRLLAGSGPAGLAGMRPMRELGEGIRLVRPFLGIAKADLVRYCAAAGLAFVSDPSNGDDRFARARLRRLLPDLAAEGLSAERLCRLAERAARDDDALMQAARDAFPKVREVQEGGGLVLNGAMLLTLPEAIVIRITALAMSQTAAEGALRLERLERLVLDELLPALAQRRHLRRTLRGLLVEVTRTGDLWLRIAPPRRAIRGAPGPGENPLAAAPPDLLGKGDGAAYIGPKRPD